MQLVRAHLRVTPCHRQILVPQQIRNPLVEPLSFTTDCKSVPQAVPTKVLDPRLKDRVVKPMPPDFKRFSSLGRLEHTPSPVAPVMHNPKGGNRCNI